MKYTKKNIALMTLLFIAQNTNGAYTESTLEASPKTQEQESPQQESTRHQKKSTFAEKTWRYARIAGDVLHQIIFYTDTIENPEIKKRQAEAKNAIAEEQLPLEKMYKEKTEKQRIELMQRPGKNFLYLTFAHSPHYLEPACAQRFNELCKQNAKNSTLATFAQMLTPQQKELIFKHMIPSIANKVAGQVITEDECFIIVHTVINDNFLKTFYNASSSPTLTHQDVQRDEKVLLHFLAYALIEKIATTIQMNPQGKISYIGTLKHMGTPTPPKTSFDSPFTPSQYHADAFRYTLQIDDHQKQEQALTFYHAENGPQLLARCASGICQDGQLAHFWVAVSLDKENAHLVKKLQLQIPFITFFKNFLAHRRPIPEDNAHSHSENIIELP